MSNDLRRFSFVQFDVFASRPFEGNSLAVYPDARGLDDSQLQAIAREMNLSETTFIFPRDATIERERGVRVRIFTVQEELPFAGHPTLGTAFVLRGHSGLAEVRLELNVGIVPVRFTQPELSALAFGEMTQVNPEFGAIHDAETIAGFTNLSASDFLSAAPIQTIPTGLPYTIVRVRST